MAWDKFVAINVTLDQFDVRLTAAEAGVTPTPTPTLNAMTLSPGTATVGTAYTGTVTGKTTSSSLGLTGTGAAGLSLTGTSVSGTPTTAGTINIVETLAGATNSPRTSSGVATVSAAAVTLNALTLSPNTGTTGTAYSGTVTGKTAGSVLSLTGAGAAGLNVSGTTVSGTPTTAGAVNIVETLAGATNSPSTSNGVMTVAAAATGGTSASRYSVMGTGLRLPQTPATVPAGFPYVCSQFGFYTPDYPTNSYRMFFPTFYNVTAGELALTSPITIFGMSYRVNGGTWTAVGGAFPFAYDPATDTAGKLTLDLDVGTVPAGALIEFRTDEQRTPGSTVSRAASISGYASQGSATRQTALLTSTAALSNTNTGSGIIFPSAVIAKGGDGRPALLLGGDSIGYGADLNNATVTHTARREVGYLSVGFDDNATTKRIPTLNICCPGQSPSQWATPANIARKTAMLQALCAANTGNVAAWDEIVDQHGTNSTASTLSPFLSEIRATIANLRSASNSSAMPATQLEMLAYPASTDGYATLANQSGSTPGATYPNGVRWQVNAAIGGPDGLGDPTATLRADETIQYSFAPWRRGSFDTGSNRDKLRLLTLPAGTTLASDYSGTGAVSLTGAPAIGQYLAIRHTGGTMYGIVIAVTGAGPYSVTLLITAGLAAITVANVLSVTATMHGSGLHPGGEAHSIYKDSVVDYKTSRGWTA